MFQNYLGKAHQHFEFEERVPEMIKIRLSGYRPDSGTRRPERPRTAVVIKKLVKFGVFLTILGPEWVLIVCR